VLLSWANREPEYRNNMKRHSLLAAAAFALALLAASCAAPRHGGTEAAFPDFRLRFLADLHVRTGKAIGDLDPKKFGGLSSLSCDHDSDTFLALSDDKADCRIYSLSISVVPGGLDIRPLGVLYLRDADGNPFPPMALDPEGLAVLPDGSLVVSSETRAPGDDSPAILRFSPRGVLLGEIPVPEKFLPAKEGDSPKGTRFNASFEALTLAPDEPRLFTAGECALVQDGEPSSPRSGCLARILEYDLAGPEPAAVAEFAYPVDAVAVPIGSRPGRGDSGLTELVALGGREFLSLERSYFIEDKGRLPRRSRTRIRIYRFSLAGAQDISSIPSLKETDPVRPIAKKLILDLSDVVRRFKPGFRYLDNFEAMDLGPHLNNGRRTLLLLSDNNFSPTQRTAFLAFEIIPR